MSAAQDLARRMAAGVTRRLPYEMPSVPLIGADDSRWSVISSAADFYLRNPDELVEVLLSAAETARSLHLTEVERRSSEQDAVWVATWPGEHYRLLAALAHNLDTATMVEVGTFKGHGALAISAGNPDGRVITYDILPWDSFADTALRASDFDGTIEQRIGDLGDPTFLTTQIATLREADLIFIDGPKDGAWEQHAVPRILEALSDRRRLVVFDDIRLLEMVQLWRDLPYLKLDATSLGHWSGTGLLYTA